MVSNLYTTFESIKGGVTASFPWAHPGISAAKNESAGSC